MRWNGETKKQRYLRLSEWHRRFALFPVQMTEGDDAGKWVWLEHYECRIRINASRTAWIFDRRTPGTPDGPETFPPPPPLKRF